MSEFDTTLAALAAKHHSIVTLGDVKAAGGSRRHMDRRVVGGHWEECHDKVYRLMGVPWTYEAKVYAAVAAGGVGACASHLCAARLHGLGFATAGVEISIPRGRNFRSKELLIHTSTDLDKCRRVLAGGVATTDPARTILDVARYLRLPSLRRAIEAGRRKELLDWHDLVETLAAHARKGRHGVELLRNAIAVGMPDDEVTDTDSELVAWSLFREFGLPEPTMHHRIYEPDGRLTAEIDFAYAERRVGYEIDGEVHRLPEVREKDEARDHDLRTRLGWTIRRIWWEIPVRQPEKFVRIVRETLR